MLGFGWYAVPESFKVYLTVDINEAAKREFGDEKRKETENFETIEEQKQDLIKRYNLENERYFKKYSCKSSCKGAHMRLIYALEISTRYK